MSLFYTLHDVQALNSEILRIRPCKKIAAVIQLSHTGINLFAFIDILAQSVKQLVGIFVPFLLKFQSSLLFFNYVIY